MSYHLFVCHWSAGSEAAPALDELATGSVLQQLAQDGGGSYETLLIDMGSARVEDFLPRLLDPSS